jgi:hypothetical protein
MTALSSILATRSFQWAILLALLCCYPFSLVMEPTWAWETGILEIAQTCVLVAGFVFAASAWLDMRPGRAAMLALCVMPVWIILAGRELSWGAVFLPGLDTGIGRPVYSSKILWYRPLVAPIAGGLLLAALYLGWRHRVDRVLRAVAAAGLFPWGLVPVMVLVALASSLAEGHLGMPRSAFPQAESFEELVELVGYIALVAAQARVFHASRVLERSGTAARQPEMAGR